MESWPDVAHRAGRDHTVVGGSDESPVLATYDGQSRLLVDDRAASAPSEAADSSAGSALTG
ncbi:hypothetical protein H4R18_000647 [Coemansia javaensis]|uniref:Uncharacterized protein n=1 Tax=Coemansia javaensis TaxID=2761396 RepID=A0A9W8LMG7_9FUNG|nr:hypothetical protein H4R18_000647 [Coemansia javaensis]